jgi:tRNA threonylcarbamoyladenosine biosynthesis protein TsaE
MRITENNGMSATAAIVALSGDLGAGKTTFAQGIAGALGIAENVTSPTFVIQKIYPIPQGRFPFTHLVHIDAYRLEREAELEKIGWHERATDPHNLIVIEWPERVAALIPLRAWGVELSHEGESSRVISISPPAV